MRVSFHFGQKSGAEAQVLVLESALSICDRRPSIAERQMQTLWSGWRNVDGGGISAELGDIAHG